MPPVVRFRFLLVLLYAAYLAYAGLFFLLAPWSDVWTMLVIRLPLPAAVVLGHPLVKGVISGFGVLHFVVAFAEATTGLRSKTEQ